MNLSIGFTCLISNKHTKYLENIKKHIKKQWVVLSCIINNFLSRPSLLIQIDKTLSILEI